MLSKFIYQLRKKNNFTQEVLASRLDISRPTYIQIERGEKDITISQAERLADIFNITLEDFLAKRVVEPKIILEKKKEKNNLIQIRVTSKNLDKFKQVFLYILSKIGSKSNIGETVIHKILYFIDFDYYEKFEENLMGLTYIKNYHGPTPVELRMIIRDMQKNNEIEAINSHYFKYEQKKYLPLKKPDLNSFSAREIEHIDEVLARLSDKNAKEIEAYSHGDIPWITAKNGQPISYESVFYRDDRYSVRNYDDEL